MSIEPTCTYCGSGTKLRCKSLAEAGTCMNMRSPATAVRGGSVPNELTASRRITSGNLPTGGGIVSPFAGGSSTMITTGRIKPPPGDRAQMTLEDFNFEVPTKVSSHWEGDHKCISISQREGSGDKADIILIDVDKIDTLIDYLTTIKNHVS